MKINLIKIGGSVLNSRDSIKGLFKNLSEYISNGDTVIVHGGGKAISFWLDRLGMDVDFLEGQRITGEDTIGLVEMVLSGLINKEIVSVLSSFGFNALGISGRDAGIATANIKDMRLGRVGELDHIEIKALHELLKCGFLPVISPVSNDENGFPLNINADLFAGELAAAIKAESLYILTDTGGVLEDDRIIDMLDIEEIEDLKERRVVRSGMIPKLNAAAIAVKAGVKNVGLMDNSANIGTVIK